MKSGTFIRQGSSQPQSAKEFSPARKHLSRKCKKVDRRNWSCEVMSTSHPGGKRTTKCQGVGVVSRRECSQGISACCKQHSSQAKACPKRLCNLPIQAFPWCKCGQYSEMPVLWWLPSKSGWIQTPLETQGSAPKTSLLNPRNWSYSKWKKVCTKIYFKLLLSSSASNVCKRPHPVNLCCVDQQGNLHCWGTLWPKLHVCCLC